MARSTAPALAAEDQAVLDQMRADDAAATELQPSETPSIDGSEAASSQGTQSPDQTGQTVADQQAPRQQTVSHQAFHEEREERKRVAAELAVERQERQRLDERMNMILRQMEQNRQAAQPKPEEPALPDLSQDPVGHILGRQSNFERQLQDNNQASAQQLQAIAQHLQAQQIQEQIATAAQGMERQFTAEHPDYGQAVQFLMGERDKELAAIGQSPQQRMATIRQEGFALAAHAMQVQKNPAEVLYQLAQIRGYKVPSAEPAPAAQAAQQVIPPPQERLQNVANGQAQNVSLSNVTGSAPPPRVDARVIANMSEREFEKYLSSNPDGLRAALGG